MVLREAKTRGGKYRIKLYQATSGCDVYDIEHFVNGNSTGCNHNIPGLVKANAKFDEIIALSTGIDNINYKEIT